jgi:hypothetical protein
MNRKQIISSIIFIVLVLFLGLHLTYILRTNGDVNDRFVGFYAEKNDSIDAVFIGSSPLPACVATPKIYGETGITVYPLSSNMQRPVATKYLVEEALKSQKPDLFIFEMRMWQAADQDLLGNMAHTREVTDNMKYSVNRIKTINAMVDDKNDRINYYFDIFKYHSNWKTLFLWSQFRTAFYCYPEDLKGSLVETEVGPCDKPVILPEDDKEPMPSEQEQYLNDLLDYLDENNINALFVITPYAVKDHEQRRFNYMADIITGRGYNFLDMNRHLDEIGLDYSKDIRDYGTHTNVSGAEKVTTFLEKYLLENYRQKGIALTADHREDPRYKSWDKAYDKWKKEYEEGLDTIASNLENGIYYEMPGEDD